MTRKRTGRNYSTESNRFYSLMFLPSEHTSSILLVFKFFFLLHQPERDQTVTREMDKLRSQPVIVPGNTLGPSLQGQDLLLGFLCLSPRRLQSYLQSPQLWTVSISSDKLSCSSRGSLDCCRSGGLRWSWV